MKYYLTLAFICVTTLAIAQVKVGESNKFLKDSRTGQPFFWMGDTAWELFHRMTREDIIYYLDKRESQGFNVIQAVVLAELDGLTQANRYGDVPFSDLNTLEWAVSRGADPEDAEAYDYWDHVDFVVKEAAKRGLYIGMLPTWGDKVAHEWGSGPQVFNDQNAYDYAKKLAERYQDQWNIIWILGGDRPGFYERNGQHFDDRPVWRSMAKAIKDICGEETFITYHTGGSGESSAAWFADEDWLSMYAVQSGHGSRSYPVWDYIRSDLQNHPHKPVMDMEPCYENHPVNPWDGKWTREGRGYFSSADVRIRMYRGVFAGGVGTTYGHHSVWQFLDTTLHEPVFIGDTIVHWKAALDAEVATQIHFLKDLILDQDDMYRIEDSLLIASDRGSDYRDLILATRNESATYALIHLPQPKPIHVNLDRLKAGRKVVRWFNPSNGTYHSVERNVGEGIEIFSPPSDTQQDWVLVLQVE